MKTRPDIEYEQLLPCPFCAGEASIGQGTRGKDPWWYIECVGCGSMAESEAIWNTRKFPGRDMHEELES